MEVEEEGQEELKRDENGRRKSDSITNSWVTVVNRVQINNHVK